MTGAGAFGHPDLGFAMLSPPPLAAVRKFRFADCCPFNGPATRQRTFRASQMSQKQALPWRTPGRLFQQHNRIGLQSFRDFLYNPKRRISSASLKFAKVAVRETYIVRERF